MFKKGYYYHSYGGKGHMTQQDKLLGNYTSHHMVHAWVKANDFDLTQNRRAGNHLEKSHK
jgi:hypothetical protein